MTLKVPPSFWELVSLFSNFFYFVFFILVFYSNLSKFSVHAGLRLSEQCASMAYSPVLPKYPGHVTASHDESITEGGIGFQRRNTGLGSPSLFRPPISQRCASGAPSRRPSIGANNSTAAQTIHQLRSYRIRVPDPEITEPNLKPAHSSPNSPPLSGTSPRSLPRPGSMVAVVASANGILPAHPTLQAWQQLSA